MTEYGIHEIFHSFQGEGVHMGLSAFFVRTQGCAIRCPWCLGEGVRLHTARGRVDVKDVRVGDLVWSFNEKIQRQELTGVLAVESRMVSSYYEITWRGEGQHTVTAKMTGEHPFWVVGQGWVEAKDLTSKIPIGAWQCGGRHLKQQRGDVVLEIDSKSYISALRSCMGRNQSVGRRRRASLRMRLGNPMWEEDTRNKVSQTIKRRMASGEIEVPDFVCEDKRKVIEVTDPRLFHRKEKGYHRKNKKSYRTHGYECLTLYVPRAGTRYEREVTDKLVQFAFNGKEVLYSEQVNEPIKVYSIRTANHTFFVEGVLTHNCDSAGTWSPDWVPKEIDKMTAAEIVVEAVASHPSFVVVTGGEPAHWDLTELVDDLHMAGLPVHLETSGGFPIRGKFDWITLSPKKWKPPLAENVKAADEFKVIVETPEDIELYLEMIRSLGYYRPADVPVWLHPEWSRREDVAVLRAICDTVKKDKRCRAGWQMHKLFRVDQLDVRTKPLVPLGGNLEKGY